MRFNSSPNSELVTASDILNGSSELELMQIFKKFADERFAPVLAAKIIEARQGTILATTGDFKTAILNAFPNCSSAERN